ncbi:OB-fold domain-containing protein [Aromatoleum toluclasticum]|uniref:Zn-ribbon domain-containing OB-fold protein n=1 Tax=Aromatoleum toluclasticum TaxID=92003 RepID=UPI001D1849D4|nr:OB-fold domain-containing protein [Aromatoleum toluclasticum]MCC4118254.1 OB-fold domain-containing protein [Aromatoleum toluclasticum]
MDDPTNKASLREPCVPGLFSEEGEPSLHGARCTCCNTPYFPRVAACRNPGCDESRIVPCTFGGEGRLWSYSVADFPPPPPHRYDKPFVPYAIGVVDLDSGLRVVGQMVDPVEFMQVGSRVRLVIEPIHHEDGRAFTSWKFKLLDR